MKGNIARTAFLVSLNIHILIFIVLYILPYKRIKEERVNQATLEVDILENKALVPIPHSLPIKLKSTLLESRKERSIIYPKPSLPSKHSKESDSKIDEVLEKAPV